MSLSIPDAIKAALLPLVTEAITIAETSLPKLLPGLPGALVGTALALPGVQSLITSLEGKAVEEAAALFVAGYTALRKEVVEHVHGVVGQWLQKVLPQTLPPLNVSPEQWMAIVQLAEAGKLTDALKYAGAL